MQPTVQWPPFSISHMSTSLLTKKMEIRPGKNHNKKLPIASHIDGNDLKLCLNSYSHTIKILENVSRNRMSTYEPTRNQALRAWF